jgi:hypothetical protein
MANGYSATKSLDKAYLCDKLEIYPKVYSPSTCIYTDSTLQARYRVRKPGRKGIGIEQQGNSYRARIAINKKKLQIGKYETLEIAILARNNYIVSNNLDFPLEICKTYTEPINSG